MRDLRCNPFAMPRTIRSPSAVQSVRNIAHNLLLFRCAIHCPMSPLKSYNRMQWSQPQTMRSLNRF
jgi:hypothetical protein